MAAIEIFSFPLRRMTAPGGESQTKAEADSGDRARGPSPLAGGAAVFAAWGERARPGFPLGERERGFDSLLPQACIVRFHIGLLLIRENKHVC